MNRNSLSTFLKFLPIRQCLKSKTLWLVQTTILRIGLTQGRTTYEQSQWIISKYSLSKSHWRERIQFLQTHWLSSYSMKLRHNHQGKTSIRFGDIGGVMIPMQAGLDQNIYSRLLLNQTFMKTLMCSMILQLGIKTTSSMCFIGQNTSAKSCHQILKSRH